MNVRDRACMTLTVHDFGIVTLCANSGTLTAAVHDCDSLKPTVGVMVAATVTNSVMHSACLSCCCN